MSLVRTALKLINSLKQYQNYRIQRVNNHFFTYQIKLSSNLLASLGGAISCKSERYLIYNISFTRCGSSIFISQVKRKQETDVSNIFKVLYLSESIY